MEGTNSEGGRRPCNIRFILIPSPGSSLPLGRGGSNTGMPGSAPRWRDGGREVGGGERLMGERMDKG